MSELHNKALKRVAVITGAGGIGLAAAQRIGSGKLVILADISVSILEAAGKKLRGDGFDVQTRQIDIADKAAVTKLAELANSYGVIDTVVHTAGLSNITGTAQRVYNVNLLGTAFVIDAFAKVIGQGGHLVVIASLAAKFASLPAEFDKHFMETETDSLLQTPAIDLKADTSDKAYAISKRANTLRVTSAAKTYGDRGARINSISPGVIATAMSAATFESPIGDSVRQMISVQPVPRLGTPQEVAEVVGRAARHVVSRCRFQASLGLCNAWIRNRPKVNASVCKGKVLE